VDDTLSHLGDLAAHFLSGSQMQFDALTCAAREKADDCRVRLQSGFFLSEHTARHARGNNGYEKK